MPQSCNTECCTQSMIPCEGPSYCTVPSLCWKNLELAYSDKYNTANASKFDMVNRLQNNDFGIKYAPSMISQDYRPNPRVGMNYPGGIIKPDQQGDYRNWPGGRKGKGKGELDDRISSLGPGLPVATNLSMNSQFWTVDDGTIRGDGTRKGKGSFRNISRRHLPAPPSCPFRLLSFSQSWNLKNHGKICVYRKDTFPNDDSNSIFTPHIESWGLYTKLVGEFKFGVTIQLFNPSVSQSMASLFGYGTAGVPNYPTDRTTESCRDEEFSDRDEFAEYRQNLGGSNFSNDITASSQKTFEWCVPVSIEYTPLDRDFKSTITRVIGSDTMQWTTESLPFINFKHLTTPEFIMEYLGQDFMGQNLSFNDILTQKMIQSGSYPSISSAIYGGNFNSLKNLLFGFFSGLIETLFLHNGKIAASFSFTRNRNSSPCTWTGSVMGQGQSLYIPAPSNNRMNPRFERNPDFYDTSEDENDGNEDGEGDGDSTNSSSTWGSTTTIPTPTCFNRKKVNCRRRDPYTRRSLVNYFIPTTGTPVVVNNFPFGTTLVCGTFGKCYGGCDPKSFSKNTCCR